MRALSTLATLILDLAFMPIRIAVVESRWLAGHGQQPGDGIADCDFDVLAHRGRRRLNDR
jgi:hypothetical protein